VFPFRKLISKSDINRCKTFDVQIMVHITGILYHICLVGSAPSFSDVYFFTIFFSFDVIIFVYISNENFLHFVSFRKSEATLLLLRLRLSPNRNPLSNTDPSATMEIVSRTHYQPDVLADASPYPLMLGLVHSSDIYLARIYILTDTSIQFLKNIRDKLRFTAMLHSRKGTQWYSEKPLGFPQYHQALLTPQIRCYQASLFLWHKGRQ